MLLVVLSALLVLLPCVKALGRVPSAVLLLHSVASVRAWQLPQRQHQPQRFLLNASCPVAAWARDLLVCWAGALVPADQRLYSEREAVWQSEAPALAKGPASGWPCMAAVAKLLQREV